MALPYLAGTNVTSSETHTRTCWSKGVQELIDTFSTLLLALYLLLAADSVPCFRPWVDVALENAAAAAEYPQSIDCPCQWRAYRALTTRMIRGLIAEYLHG